MTYSEQETTTETSGSSNTFTQLTLYSLLSQTEILCLHRVYGNPHSQHCISPQSTPIISNTSV